MVTGEKGTSMEKTPPQRLACRQVGIFVVNDWYERAQLTVGRAAPWQVVLGLYKRACK